MKEPRADPTDTSADIIRRLNAILQRTLAPLSPQGPLVLLDFPNHANVGDSAIWLGEIAFFRTHWGVSPAVSFALDNVDWEILKRQDPGLPIFLHGGGNFGDIHEAHQLFREEILAAFPGRPVVQLPQTVYFRKDAALRRTADAIRRHGNFRMFVRDKRSLSLVQRAFDCPVELCPDMAFALGAQEPPAAPSRETLWLMRSDREVEFGEGRPDFAEVEDWMADNPGSYKLAQLRAWGRALASGAPQSYRPLSYEGIARARVERGLRHLSSARTVVTDRLHAHILCLLLDKPHKVIDSAYGKIDEFIQCWTRRYEKLDFTSTGSSRPAPLRAGEV